MTVIINADNYAEETSWEIYDETNNEIVATGQLNDDEDGQTISEDICVDYSSCLTLRVFDSFGDGICCGFGQGNFLMQNAAGETIFTNDGDFSFEVTEFFCPNGEGCAFTADIEIINTTEENVTDGMLTINPSSGFGTFQYSIDGGATFVDDNTFENLAIGDYPIVIQDANGICSYEETVTIEVEIIDNVNDISSTDIKIFPNPTDDMLVIEIGKTSTISGAINVEIHDCFGRMIEKEVISNFGGESKAIISLKDHAPGSYFVKCWNEGFEEYFKVVRI